MGDPKSTFLEKPSESVILAEIEGGKVFTSHIIDVWGYDVSRDAWSVSLVRCAVQQGLWGESITVWVKQRADKKWVLA